jgi:hypothetical protein
MMKFPCNASKQTSCPACGKRGVGKDYPKGAPFETTRLIAGAMTSERGKSRPVYLGSFLMLGWAGAGNETGATVEVTNLPNPGPRERSVFTLSFCSTQCLRSFVNASIDLLETRISEAKKVKPSSKPR